VGSESRIDLQAALEHTTATLLLVAVTSLVIFLAGSGKVALSDPDESRYALVGWNMLRTGDWLTPQLYHEPYFDKPPLYFWLTALSFKLLGTTEFAARLVPAVGAMLVVVACYLLALELYGSNCALLAGVALLTTATTLVVSKFLRMDVYLVLWISLTLLAFVKGYKAEGSSRWFLVMYVAAALAMLTKGPVGVLIPFATIGIFLALNGQLSKVLDMKVIAGLAILIVIGCPWFIYMAVEHEQFLRKFFWEQHVQRWAAGKFGHRDNPLMYLAFLIVGFLPWTPLLLPAIVYAAREGFGVKRAWQERFLLIWAGFVVVFFSLGKTKMVNYVLPAFVPLAVLLGRYFQQYLWSDLPMRRSRWAFRTAYAGVLACCVLMVFTLLLSTVLLIWLRFHGRWEGMEDMLAGSWRGRWGHVLSVAYRLAAAAVMVKVIWACKDRRMVELMVGACAAAAVLLAVDMSYQEAPRLADMHSSKSLMGRTLSRTSETDPVLVGPKPKDLCSMAFYLRGRRAVRPVEHVANISDYKRYAGRLVFLAGSDKAYAQARYIFGEDRVALLARSGSKRLLLVAPLAAREEKNRNATVKEKSGP